MFNNTKLAKREKFSRRITLSVDDVWCLRDVPVLQFAQKYFTVDFDLSVSTKSFKICIKCKRWSDNEIANYYLLFLQLYYFYCSLSRNFPALLIFLWNYFGRLPSMCSTNVLYWKCFAIITNWLNNHDNLSVLLFICFNVLLICLKYVLCF